MKALVLGTAAFALAIAPISQSQQQPTFRGRIDLVPLTVVVLDKKGMPVADLKQSDFTVFENNSVREIVNFFPQSFTPQPAAVERMGPTLNRVPLRTGLAPETRRTFLLVLGYGRIQEPIKALDGAMAFVRTKLLPQDFVAVLAFNRATDFTTDHEQIARLLDRYKREHERIVFEIREFRLRNLPGTPLPESIQRDVDAVFSGPDGDPARSAVNMLLGMDAVKSLNEKPWDRQANLSDLLQHASVTWASLSDGMILANPMKVFAGLEYLRYLEGEKHLIYLGGQIGSLIQSRQMEASVEEERRLARRFNDAHVSLNVISTSGVGGMSLLSAGRIQWMQGATERTGGSYTGVNYADKALSNIDQATRHSYLIGYVPVDPSLDGRYRDVKVKVNRPDVSLRFRHGYYASEQPDPLDLPEIIRASRMDAAASFAGDSGDIKLDVQAFALPRMGLYGEVRVSVRVDAARIAFTKRGAETTAALNFKVYCADNKEVIVGEAEDDLVLDAAGDAQARLLKEGIRHTLKVRVMTQPRFVKVIVFDQGSDLLGSKVITLR